MLKLDKQQRQDLRRLYKLAVAPDGTSGRTALTFIQNVVINA